jgi:triacylglycerol esterase/lipase EstA (alpha/beta hydrolase family)
MLARLQKVLVLSLAAACCAWLWWWWPRSPLVALGGSLAMALAYSAVLGLEFVLLRIAGAHDQAMRPGASELLRAWWGETLVAPRVFCWRQPFFSGAVPDHLPASGLRGVVFIHGFVCNRGFWTPWLQRLRAQDRAFVAVNLEPVFGPIERYVDAIDEAVRRVFAATGRPPVLVCHSMGGLAARAWLATPDAHARVHRIFTLGTPHGGTWLGRFSRAANGRQMRLECEWLRALGAGETAELRPRFTCWYSNCDNIVFPVATATLPGADNRLLRGVAHVQLAFEPLVMEAVLADVANS